MSYEEDLPISFLKCKDQTLGFLHSYVGIRRAWINKIPGVTNAMVGPPLVEFRQLCFRSSSFLVHLGSGEGRGPWPPAPTREREEAAGSCLRPGPALVIVVFWGAYGGGSLCLSPIFLQFCLLNK